MLSLSGRSASTLPSASAEKYERAVRRRRRSPAKGVIGPHMSPNAAKRLGRHARRRADRQVAGEVCAAHRPRGRTRAIALAAASTTNSLPPRDRDALRPRQPVDHRLVLPPANLDHPPRARFGDIDGAVGRERHAHRLVEPARRVRSTSPPVGRHHPAGAVFGEDHRAAGAAATPVS